MEFIKIKYLRDIQKIERFNTGDWIDLRAAEDTAMRAGEHKMIPLGVAMELPHGYEALVAPRSSTFKKYGIISANSLGIIDESFKGDGDEWHFIIKHQPLIQLTEVQSLGNKDRGGIGSTGRV